MQPVIIGVRKKPTRRNNDLPKINSFMYIPIRNKQHFPHKGPIVLITDIRDTLLPGEEVILGPYCDCTVCQSENKVLEENPTIISQDATRQDPVKSRGTSISKPKLMKNQRIFTSTPNEEKSVGNTKTEPNKQQHNNNTSQKLNGSKNTQRSGRLEFSDIDSDSGWDKRQELLVKLNRDLEQEVDIQLRLEESKNKLQQANKLKVSIDDQQKYEASKTDKKNTTNDRDSETNSSSAKYKLRGHSKNITNNDDFKIPKTVPKPKKRRGVLSNEDNLKASQVEPPKTSKRKGQTPIEKASPQVKRLKEKKRKNAKN